MREAVARLWPEIAWIQNAKLRSQVTETWIKALERSPLKADDLNRIPFTLLVPNCPITFMEHKRCVVHIARESARAMQEFMGRALPIDMDTVIAGAILADVGKLLEYELGPERRCAIPSRVSLWRWNAGCLMLFATSSPPTQPRVI